MSPVEHSHMQMFHGIRMVYEKMSVESILTVARGVTKVDSSHPRRVLEHLNVTCKTSTASIVGKEWFENEAWGDMGEYAYQ